MPQQDAINTRPAAICAESFRRCLAAPDFFTRFYDALFRRAPEVRRMFANVDFATQEAMMRKGIADILLLAAGSPAAGPALDRIRATHGPSGLNLTPILYRRWRESLLEAVAAFDPEHSPEVTAAWDQVLQAGTTHLTR